MDHNFYVVCVGQNFLHGSIFFTWVNIFCGGLNFCVSGFLGVVVVVVVVGGEGLRGFLKKILIGSFTSSFT